MKIKVAMPQLGESVSEGEVVAWLKQEGESVGRDEALVEVKTDKATVEVPSPAAGTLHAALAGEGETVEVGADIAVIETESGEAAVSTEMPSTGARETAPSVDLGRSPEQQAPSEPAREPAKAEREEAPEPRETPPAEERPEPRKPEPAPAPRREEDRGRPLMTPLARRLARERGVDLSGVQGSGAGGRITREDVEQATEKQKAKEGQEPAESPGAPEQPEPAPQAEEAPMGEEDRAVALSPMRRRIAARLVRSAQTIPHVTTVVECDYTAVAELRRQHKEAWEKDGLKLTYLPFLMRAACAALREHEEVNASWGGDKLILHGKVHLAIAVAVEKGLAVPVIRDAGGMGLRQLARRLDEVAAHARAGKMTQEEAQGGTFTITNPGVFGAFVSAPIINPPNAAILGVCRIAQEPVVREGEIVPRLVGRLCLSYDHRIVDGETAIKFLGTMRGLLEEGEFGMD